MVGGIGSGVGGQSGKRDCWRRVGVGGDKWEAKTDVPPPSRVPPEEGLGQCSGTVSISIEVCEASLEARRRYYHSTSKDRKWVSSSLVLYRNILVHRRQNLLGQRLENAQIEKKTYSSSIERS